MEGKSSDFFLLIGGFAQGCTLSPTLFSIYINVLLSDIKKCQQIGVKFSKNRLSGLLFADDFVGLAKTGPALQNLINVVYNYSKRWRVEDNIKKCSCNFFSSRKFLGVCGFGVKRAFLF